MPMIDNTNGTKLADRIKDAMKHIAANGGQESYTMKDIDVLCIMGKDPVFFRKVLQSFPDHADFQTIYKKWLEMRQ